MRNLVLGGLLAVTSATAVIYAVVNPTPKPVVCTEQPKPVEIALPTEEPGCSKCKPGVVDVVDLNAAYPITTQTPGSTVSFEEPPFAKPKQPGIIPAEFVAPVEQAPAPREAAELAPAPKLVK